MTALLAAWAIAKKVFGLLPLKDWLWIGLVVVLVGYHLTKVHEARVAGETAAKAECIAAQKKAQAAYEAEVASIQAEQQKVITRTVIEYRDRVQIVKEKGDEVVREVDKIVPHTVGMLPGGMRVIHDAAASGVLPADPERAAAAAAPVDASTLAATVATNYEACRANAAQLVALQDLVKSLEKP